MSSCRCSTRALELFVRDLAGLSSRRFQLHQSSTRPLRRFSTRPPFRQLETVNAVTTGDEGFVPFEFEHGTVGQGIHAGESKDDVADEEWHAELEIAKPWPHGTRAAGHSEQEGISEDNLNTSASQEEAELHARPVNEHDGMRTAQVEESVSTTEPSARNIAEPVKSRAQSRLQRKLRRIEAGAYRPQHEQNKTEAEAEAGLESIDDQTESVLEKIKALEGPALQERQVVKGKNARRRERMQDERSAAKSASLEASKGKGQQFKKKDAFDRASSTKKPKPVDQEEWGIQKSALLSKFGDQGWQPRKRLSPDTMSGIRALHASDTVVYNTEMLADHFKITPEAIRRILRSKWRPNEEEAEDRRERWERRGVKKWGEMAKEGVRPPRKWRDMGVRFQKNKKVGLAAIPRKMGRTTADTRGAGEQDAGRESLEEWIL